MRRIASSKQIKSAVVCSGLVAAMVVAGFGVYRYRIARSIVDAIENRHFERAFRLTTENDLPAGRFRLMVFRAAYVSPMYHRFLLDRWHKYEGTTFPSWARLVLYSAVVSETLDPQEVMKKAGDKRRQLQSNQVNPSQKEELQFVDTIEKKALEMLSEEHR